MTGMNRYLSVGVKGDWIRFLLENGTEPGARKTDVMYAFLSDAGVMKQKKLTLLGEKIKQIGLFDTKSWAIMLCELVYSPAFNWFVRNIPFGVPYTFEDLNAALDGLVTEKAKSEFWNGFKQILDTMPYGYEIRFGVPTIERKNDRNVEEKKKLISITRWNWVSPCSTVILYSLYKFAEACGDYYEFTVSRLLNYHIDSDGISPTQIFGIEEDELKTILQGLTASNPDFITAKFTHDLDTISLNRNKRASDVLELL
jgi:phosphoadenosine phosphosulfate reductase